MNDNAKDITIDAKIDAKIVSTSSSSSSNINIKKETNKIAQETKNTIKLIANP